MVQVRRSQGTYRLRHRLDRARPLAAPHRSGSAFKLHSEPGSGGRWSTRAPACRPIRMPGVRGEGLIFSSTATGARVGGAMHRARPTAQRWTRMVRRAGIEGMSGSLDGAHGPSGRRRRRFHMSSSMKRRIDRREFMLGASALSAASLLGIPSRAAAEPPPEVTKIRLVKIPGDLPGAGVSG